MKKLIICSNCSMNNILGIWYTNILDFSLPNGVQGACLMLFRVVWNNKFDGKKEDWDRYSLWPQKTATVYTKCIIFKFPSIIQNRGTLFHNNSYSSHYTYFNKIWRDKNQHKKYLCNDGNKKLRTTGQEGHLFSKKVVICK